MDREEKELASIPIGIQVTHSPSPAKARAGDLTVEEFRQSLISPAANPRRGTIPAR